MNVSPEYAKEYHDWISRGQFENVYRWAVGGLPKHLKDEHPALMAMDLGSIATCYYTRGVITLLNGDQTGWHDVQCGYWAALYRLRFELMAVTLPAWSAGRHFSSTSQVELVLTLGLGKLFQQECDVSWLLSAIHKHFDSNAALGNDLDDGNLILNAILETEDDFSYADLLKDRKECCKKRDAWPKRPTEIRPFGVLDIEAILRFPEEASFRFPSPMGFEPTEDSNVVESVTAFHNWYE